MPAGWVAAAGAVAGVVGGMSSASKAAKAQKQAQTAAIAEQQRAETVQREDLAPWRETGQNALMQVANLNGLNGAEAQTAAMAGFRSDPGYQFMQDEARRSVEASAASRGLLRSGATMNALLTRSAGIADQSFGNYLARLNSLASSGLNAAARQGDATAGAARDVSQSYATGAQAQSSVYGAENAALQQGIRNGVSLYANGQNQNPSQYGGKPLVSGGGSFSWDKFTSPTSEGGGKSDWGG